MGPQGPTGLIEDPYAGFIRAFYDFCTQYNADMNDSNNQYISQLETENAELRQRIALLEQQNCEACGEMMQPADEK